MKAKFVKLQKAEESKDELDDENPSSEKRISAQDLKDFDGCGDFTDDEAEEITFTIHRLSELLYDLILGSHSDEIAGIVIPLYDEAITNDPNEINIAA